ncbi:MAG: Cytidylyltransferase family protein [Methanosaeta sp. PtaU1.Bin112]|nr:MAG: Cytidylyltransferase family protein [Methanosaeta sp. PtaU1.Bin112]
MSFFINHPLLLLLDKPLTGKAGNFFFELRRKLIHLFFGLFLILLLFFSSRIHLIFFLSTVLIFGIIMILLMQSGRKIPIADWLLETFERENVRFPGYGAFWYVAGSLLLALFLDNIYEIAAGVVILAAGDSAATIFGIIGCRRLPYNRRKTWEGSIAFFVFSLPACLFVGWIGAALAAIAAFAESLPTPVDDNLLVPASVLILFLLI